MALAMNKRGRGGKLPLGPLALGGVGVGAMALAMKKRGRGGKLPLGPLALGGVGVGAMALAMNKRGRGSKLPLGPLALGGAGFGILALASKNRRNKGVGALAADTLKRNSRKNSFLGGGLLGGGLLGGLLGWKGIKMTQSQKRKLGRTMALMTPIGGAAVIGGAMKRAGAGKVLERMWNPKTKVGKALSLLTPIGMAGAISRGWKKLTDDGKFKARPQDSASNILGRYNSTIKPVLEKGMGAKYGEVNKKIQNDIHIKNDPHDININGTLKLQGQDGKSVDMITELKNNPDMMRNLAGMVSNEMSVLQKGANIVQRT